MPRTVLCGVPLLVVFHQQVHMSTVHCLAMVGPQLFMEWEMGMRLHTLLYNIQFLSLLSPILWFYKWNRE